MALIASDLVSEQKNSKACGPIRPAAGRTRTITNPQARQPTRTGSDSGVVTVPLPRRCRDRRLAGAASVGKVCRRCRSDRRLANLTRNSNPEQGQSRSWRGGPADSDISLLVTPTEPEVLGQAQIWNHHLEPWYT